MNTFTHEVLEKFEVGEKALIIRRMVERYVHTEQDLEFLEAGMKRYGRNNIYTCLCKLRDSKVMA